MFPIWSTQRHIAEPSLRLFHFVNLHNQWICWGALHASVRLLVRSLVVYSLILVNVGVACVESLFLYKRIQRGDSAVVHDVCMFHVRGPRRQRVAC